MTHFQSQAAALAVLLAVPWATPAWAMRPYNATALSDQSEYALGTYTMNVVFLQDNLLRDTANASHPVSPTGSVVHWTAAELLERRQRITDAAAFWSNASAAIHHPGARLNIAVNFVNAGNPLTVASIGGEGDISPYGDALHLLNPAYSVTNDFNAVRQFNDDTRVSFNTNWAFTTFVKPFNGRASAYINGPLTNAFEDDPSWTYAHEMGHIFGALDEYAGAGNTAQRGGYLHALNTNAQRNSDGSANPDSIPALMRNANRYNLSQGTINQIGWTDTDNDTIPDILDTVPTLTANTAGTDPTLGLFQLDLDAVVTPMVSPDPGEGNYTINTLQSARYRVDDGGWQSLVPDDGLFGAYAESFTLSLSGLGTAGFVVDVEVYNSVGNAAVRRFTHVVIPEPALAIGLALVLPMAVLRRRSGLRAVSLT